MKSKLSIVAFLLVCAVIITGSIYAGGKQHENCRECKLAYGKGVAESGKFAHVCEYVK
jgi:hypothetical protein